jgi:hypothetical protein
VIISYLCLRTANQIIIAPPSLQMPVLAVYPRMQSDLLAFLRRHRPGAVGVAATLRGDALMGLAKRVTAALVFLESKHLVHRALAARQFLVGADPDDIRLASLGESRDVYTVRRRPVCPAFFHAYTCAINYVCLVGGVPADGVAGQRY